MRLGSLFAGIGGFELAATWAGIEPVWSNEIDDYACKVLNKNFKHEIIQKDIREIGAQNLSPVDIISGGFPCQPFSWAGLQKGIEDDRYLWPETLRVVNELRPPWFIGENVAGLLSMAQPIWESWVESKTHLSETEKDVVIQRAEWYVLNRIIQDLEKIGYQVQTFNIPAVAVGACHRRGRIWIVANSISDSMRTKGERRVDLAQNPLERRKREKDTIGSSKVFTNDATNTQSKDDRRYKSRKSKGQIQQSGISAEPGATTDTELWRFQKPRGESISKIGDDNFQDGWLQVKPLLRGGDDGLSNWVDRIKGLGNAIVPQVTYEIFKTIVQIENEAHNTDMD